MCIRDRSLYVGSQGFAFFVVCISLKVNPLLMQWFCLQCVLVCLFRCFLIPPASALFTLDQSDLFRWSSTCSRMKSVQCDAPIERSKWAYLSWKSIGKNVLPLFQDVGALGYSSSCAGLQSLPDMFWAVEHVLFRISVFCRELLKRNARRNSGVISRN